jgi:hypothetical protein
MIEACEKVSASVRVSFELDRLPEPFRPIPDKDLETLIENREALPPSSYGFHQDPAS